ncbi:MAG: flagellar biosynthetic protein FliQ [Bacteroidota bacterium]
MTEELIVEILTDVFYTSFLILLPVLSVSLVVGILISLFQAVTSIQEMTLTFVPKILSMAAVLILTLPWMIEKMVAITHRLFGMMNTVIK